MMQITGFDAGRAKPEIATWVLSMVRFWMRAIGHFATQQLTAEPGQS